MRVALALIFISGPTWANELLLGGAPASSGKIMAVTTKQAETRPGPAAKPAAPVAPSASPSAPVATAAKTPAIQPKAQLRPVAITVGPACPEKTDNSGTVRRMMEAISGISQPIGTPMTASVDGKTVSFLVKVVDGKSRIWMTGKGEHDLELCRTRDNTLEASIANGFAKATIKPDIHGKSVRLSGAGHKETVFSSASAAQAAR